jgi:MatE/Transposase
MVSDLAFTGRPSPPSSRIFPCWLSACGPVLNIHGLLARPEWRLFEHDVTLIARFALPAVLANVATPAGGAYVTAAMSQFSDSAVAGWAVIGRIIPIAFGAIFALSGAIAPIIGQNVGARQFDRVRSALYGGLAFAASITVLAWLALSVGASALVLLFNASGEAAELIVFFCRWLAPLFVFFGTLFVCNAACNTLGRPHYATALNWGRATLGTIPFVTLGAQWGAMEATGIYWKPVWHILEGRFQQILANAAHIKGVPGRKSDMNDAAWIADPLAHGLIRASFVPPQPIQELRDLTRTRKQLTREIVQHTQHIQSVLEEANIKLSSVIAEILGVSGRRILKAIVAGETDPRKLSAVRARWPTSRGHACSWTPALPSSLPHRAAFKDH